MDYFDELLRSMNGEVPVRENYVEQVPFKRGGKDHVVTKEEEGTLGVEMRPIEVEAESPPQPVAKASAQPVAQPVPNLNFDMPDLSMIPAPQPMGEPSAEEDPSPKYAGGGMDWLVGAAPMLAGFLAGSTRAGAEIGGRGLTGMAKIRADEEKEGFNRDLASRKLDIAQQKRDNALNSLGRGRFRTSEEVGEDGKPKKRFYDMAPVLEGKPPKLIHEQEAYKAPIIRSDASTGELSYIDRYTQEARRIGAKPSGKLDRKQEANLAEFRDKLSANKPFTEAVTSLGFSNMAKQQLGMINGIADQVLKTAVVRASGQAANSVSDRDLQSIGMSPALRARYRQAVSLAKKGVMSEENRRLMLQVLDTYEKRAKRVVKGISKSYKKIAESSGVPVDELDSFTSTYIDAISGGDVVYRVRDSKTKKTYRIKADSEKINKLPKTVEIVGLVE